MVVIADACERLVGLVGQLARQEPSPRRLLARLGREGAGIRPGPLGMVDLARGGRDLIRGRGFRRQFDDATSGQVRHFTGIAVATSLMGPRLTRWTSQRIRHDPLASADGRLTEAGIEFARRLLEGTLPVGAAAGWVHETLCAGPASGEQQRVVPHGRTTASG
jgi:hypothetical protein